MKPSPFVMFSWKTFCRPMLSDAPATPRQRAANHHRRVAHTVDTDAQRIGRLRVVPDRAYLESQSGAVDDKPGDGHHQVSEIDQYVMIEQNMSDARQIG